MLEFIVNGQTLRARKEYVLATYAQGFPVISFEFSSEWSDKAKTAIFKNGDNIYSALITDNKCSVPWEVLTDTSGNSVVEISIFGTSGSTRITTNIVEVEITDSGYTTGETPSSPSATVYEQIISELSNKASIAYISEKLKSYPEIKPIIAGSTPDYNSYTEKGIYMISGAFYPKCLYVFPVSDGIIQFLVDTDSEKVKMRRFWDSAWISWTTINPTPDSEMSSTSTNYVQNKVIKSYIDTLIDENKTVIDSSLSSTSTNPVQNKVVNKAINSVKNNGIQDVTETQPDLNNYSNGIYRFTGGLVDTGSQETDYNLLRINNVPLQEYSEEQSTSWDEIPPNSCLLIAYGNYQFYVCDTDNKLWTRQYYNGSWCEWELVNKPVDSSISGTSTNPVQNQAIKKYVDALKPTISTSLPSDSILRAGTEYYLSTKSSLSIAFETLTDSDRGKECFVRFRSGDAATVLTVDDSNIAGFDFTPTSNKICTINAKWDGYEWLLTANEFTDPNLSPIDVDIGDLP